MIPPSVMTAFRSVLLHGELTKDQNTHTPLPLNTHTHYTCLFLVYGINANQKI